MKKIGLVIFLVLMVVSLVLILPVTAVENGKIAFESMRDGNWEIYVMDADGTDETRLTNNAFSDVDAAFSPDGNKIAFTSNRDGNKEIYIMDADGTDQTRLTNRVANDTSPSWSPDGTEILYSSDYDGSYEIYVKDADGTHGTRITNSLNAEFSVQPVWSPDGEKIAFAKKDGDGDYEIYTMNPDGSGITQLTDNDDLDGHPAWSPDSSQIVFHSARSDHMSYEIYKMNADGTGVTRLTINDYSFYYDSNPSWSPDGEKVAFDSWRGTYDGTSYEIYSMDADGTHQTRLTHADNTDAKADWGRVPVPSVTLTRPNGGEIWQRGMLHTVTWTYTGSPGAFVKLTLLKAGTEVGTISASTSIGSGGTGSYTWPVSATGATGSDYKVKISSLSNPLYNDTSNNYFTLTPVPAAATITVTSPNGGETWQRGTTHTVTWSYTSSPGANVKITLLKAGTPIGTIIASTPIGSGGSGSYTWPITAGSSSVGSDYTVKVTSLTNPLYNDTSNSYFTLTPAGITPTITVTSPNGGETWQRGTTHTVTWSYTGSPGANVKITLLKAGTTIGTIIASTPVGSGGSGSYTWPITAGSSSVGSDYTVKVTSLTNPLYNDTSNSYFTLTPAGITPTITVTSPNGGETWQRGTTHTVTWSYTGSPGANVKITLLKVGTAIGTINASTSVGSGGSGSYTWPITAGSSSVGSDYTVKVTSTTNTAYTDTSNSYFTLTAASPAAIAAAAPSSAYEDGYA